LRASLVDAVRRLGDEVPQDERTPDFMSLVGQLAGDPEGRIRRPPAAAQRAMSACHNEGVSANALVAMLGEDPMLAQAVLQRANSAYYNRSGRPCLVLSEAITRQGRRSVHNVLLQQTLGSLVYSPGGAWHDMVNKTWSHMVRTGPIARSLAPLFDVDPEQAFALALLHDVGKLAVFDRIATLRTVRRSDLSLSKAALSKVLRVLHEPLGGLCALGWGLGDDAALAIASHHRDPVPATHDPANEVIWLAERVDLAVQRAESLDVPVLWRTGDLSADPEVAGRVLEGLMPKAEQLV
jgi:HD-like signal output (HDOD) protein